MQIKEGFPVGKLSKCSSNVLSCGEAASASPTSGTTHANYPEGQVKTILPFSCGLMLLMGTLPTVLLVHGLTLGGGASTTFLFTVSAAESAVLLWSFSLSFSLHFLAASGPWLSCPCFSDPFCSSDAFWLFSSAPTQELAAVKPKSTWLRSTSVDILLVS